MSERKAILHELRAKVAEIKQKGLLPRDYGNIIAKELGCTRNKVYQTVRGQTADLEIIERLIAMAEKSKEELLLERAKKVLEEE